MFRFPDVMGEDVHDKKRRKSISANHDYLIVVAKSETSEQPLAIGSLPRTAEMDANDTRMTR